jgi:hypothetical protein
MARLSHGGVSTTMQIMFELTTFLQNLGWVS